MQTAHVIQHKIPSLPALKKNVRFQFSKVQTLKNIIMTFAYRTNFRKSNLKLKRS